METLTENMPALVSQISGKNMVALDDRQDYGLPMPIQVDRIVERVDAVKEIITRVFKDEVHFGVIPGTGTKKTLLKPGFDALCLAFQFSPEFIKQPESIENDKMINLVYKCRIIHTATGRTIATGDGSCNSKEEKYRWTTTSRKCPSCNKESIGKSKEEWGGGWYCNANKGGCGSKFKKGDRSIEDQEAGRKENDNPWNFHNTITKMAQKRAGMAAIITACGLSGDFTQDMEDFQEEPNDKRKRTDADLPTIDIQAQGRGPSRPFYQEEEYYPEMDRRNDVDVQRVDIPEYTQPPIINYEDEVLAPVKYADEVKAALEAIDKELKHCKNKNDFLKLKALVHVSGQAFKDKAVSEKIMNQYYTLFPEQKKAA